MRGIGTESVQKRMALVDSVAGEGGGHLPHPIGWGNTRARLPMGAAA